MFQSDILPQLNFYNQMLQNRQFNFVFNRNKTILVKWEIDWYRWIYDTHISTENYLINE